MVAYANLHIQLKQYIINHGILQQIPNEEFMRQREYAKTEERKCDMNKRIAAAMLALLLTVTVWAGTAQAKECWYLAEHGEHDLEQTNVGYATCEEDGFYEVACRQCDYYHKEITQRAYGHTWKETHREQPTDFSAGLAIRKCSECGKTESTKIYPDGALYRGTKDSDGVMNLQLMLIECGYLDDVMDGQYGKNTENAVKAFQKDAGLQADGIAWPQTISLLEAEWESLYSYLTEGDGRYYSPFCYEWENEYGQTVTEYCENHALLWEATLSMLEAGDADSALHSYYEWQAEIISLYNVWSDLVSEPVKPKIEVNKALCIQMLEMQLDAMKSSYEANGTEIEPYDVYYGAELWMRGHAAWLCQMISTLGGEP